MQFLNEEKKIDANNSISNGEDFFVWLSIETVGSDSSANIYKREYHLIRIFGYFDNGAEKKGDRERFDV